jgi:anhydro-N-acetylmuramic acid kinase
MSSYPLLPTNTADSMVSHSVSLSSDTPSSHFIGLMSGTSMDGVDGVIATFSPQPRVLAHVHLPFPVALREALFALQAPGDNEIDREALAAHALVAVYADCCARLLREADLQASDIAAIGVHGQTIRHRPERGYTRQLNDPSRLAELTGIDVIADFRSRDVAAGGQGAPLVPAFHADLFGADGQTRVICNIGGISNLSILHGQDDVRGFDCGPGNALMDAWIERTQGLPYDAGGRFAATGTCDDALLAILLDEPFFRAAPPKSTGRDLFNVPWLDAKLDAWRQATGRPAQATDATAEAADIQATLTVLTARTIASDIGKHAPGCDAVFVCGGGAHNETLMRALAAALQDVAPSVSRVVGTQTLGVDVEQVEALAFAWLAVRFLARAPGNLAAVTGARGPRVLGALYPR